MHDNLHIHVIMNIIVTPNDDNDNDDDDTPHVWILGDVLKPLRELFDSVEVSSDPNMFHTSNRSNVFNMTNLVDHCD